MSTQEQFWRFCLDGVKTSMNIVLTNSLSRYSRLDQYAHYPSKHIPILNLDHYEVVCTLCMPVSFFLHSLSKVWSQKKNGLCPLLLRNLPLVTREQWFCCLGCIPSPEPVTSLRRVKFARSSVESSGLSRSQASLF